MKSYWIWHYGEYENYHITQVHMRREEQEYHRPAFWRISPPYVNVKFRKTFICDGGYLICHMNGKGYVGVDFIAHRADERIELTPGEHTVEVFVSNYSGLPAIFVESDVCPSDESWTCNHFAGDFEPVGYNVYFDSADKNPEVFPFEYEKKIPLKVSKTDIGTIYDFGTELFGFIDITDASPDKEYFVCYGESPEEALDTENSVISEHIRGKSSYRLRQRAFRYIHITCGEGELSVAADYEYLPLEQKGFFKCNNELFNKIYDVSKYTFQLNCREGFFDGIKRDRWIWSGDAYQSAKVNRYLFADKEIEQRTLTGLIGKEPFEQHINTILDYSLLWIIGLYEHYVTYGDKIYLSRIYDKACKLLQFCETRINADGFIEGIGDDWTFIDWSDMDKEGALCAEQMLLIKVYSVMADIAGVLGKEKCLFEQKSEVLIKKVNEYYWNEEKGAFIDSYSSGKKNVTRHANIFAIMHGIATEKQIKSIMDNVLKNDSVTKITTPYFEGYELDVLAKLGDFSKVEEMLTNYWGGMIELGAQTIWEEYDPTMKGIEHYAMYGTKFAKSLCHAWGATPIYLFGRYYLGVYATSPAYETFCVKPNLGGLEKIEGTVPVNDGEVRVCFDKKELSVVSTIPGGTLIFNGKEYKLVPHEEKIINYEKDI